MGKDTQMQLAETCFLISQNSAGIGTLLKEECATLRRIVAVSANETIVHAAVQVLPVAR